MFVLLLEIICMAVFHFQSFSYLISILFLHYFLLQILICLTVYLLVWLSFLDSLLSFIIVTLPWENSNCISFIFSKIVETNIDQSLPSPVALSLSSSFFNCPTNHICWIALDQHLILFVYLNQHLLIYNDFLYNHNLTIIQ